MRKKLLTLAMVMTMVVATTACGDSEGGDGNTTQTTKQNNENAGTTGSSDDTSKDDSNEETTGAKTEIEEYVDTIEDDKYGIAQYIKDTYPDAGIKFKKEMVIEKQDITGETANLLNTDLSYTVSSDWTSGRSSEINDSVGSTYRPEEWNMLSERISVGVTDEYGRQECTEDKYVELIKKCVDEHAGGKTLYEIDSVYKVNINGYEGYGIEIYSSQYNGRSYIFWMYIEGHVYSVELSGMLSNLVRPSEELYNGVIESGLAIISTINVK